MLHPPSLLPRTLSLGLVLLFGSPLLAAPVVDNPATAPGGNISLNLDEMWRIGGPEDEENLLGVVNQVLKDDQGHVYLLDIQLTEVQVYDSEGQYLRSLGSRGEGPGEVRRATDALFMPDGNLGIVQSFPGKIVKVDAEGLPAGEYLPGGDDPAAGGFFALRGAASRAGRLVFSGARITRGEKSRTSVSFVAAFDEKGRQTTLYHDLKSVRTFRGQEYSEKKEFFPHNGGWTLGPDGRVFIAQERNQYDIAVYLPDGTLEKTIKHPYQSWKRTAEEKQKAEDNLVPWRRRNRNRMNFVVEPTEPDIARLRVTDEGSLWVLTSRGLRDQPAGVHSTWDVYDPAGRLTHTVSIPCEGIGVRDRLFFPGDDLVVLVKQYADALKAFRGLSSEGEDNTSDEIEAQPLEVICYKIAS